MRIPHLLSTTAAMVLIGGGIAAAQGMNGNEQQGRTPAAQQHAPAEKVAPPMAHHPAKGRETTGQGSTMSPNAEHQEQGAEHQERNTTRDHNGMKREEKNGEKAGMKKGAKTNESTAQKSDEKTEMKNGANGENKSAAGEKTEQRNTTGQGAAGAARLSTEQRTKITTIFRQHKVAPVHLNVSIAVGARIPERVHFYPLPVEVVDVYPEWRGYDYILVGDQILVIDPDSHEIVAILEA
mgnify:CR=1 FL=1